MPGLFVIADATWNSKRDETFEILQSDGTSVGTIMTIGLNSGSPTPPGPPVGGRNLAIVGGTGAFFGARGQGGVRSVLLPDSNSSAGFLGLFKSTDGGESWAPINNGLAGVLDSRATVTAIALAPGNPGTVFFKAID